MKRTSKTPKHNAEAVPKWETLSAAEARFLVDNYYTSQEMRKRADMQVRHLGDKVTGRTVPPILREMGDMFADIEKIMAKGLGKYVEQSQVGKWIIAQHGVGPVIAAGMLAHLDITRAPTVGAFWRFAGLDPSCPWEKSEKRPYNARLKQLCWHFGECAKRTHNAADSFYGKLYASYKAKVEARNEAGGFAEKSATFVTKDPKEQKKIRASGIVPPHYLDKMANRYAAKIFLSHLHAIMYWDHLQESPAQALRHRAHGACSRDRSAYGG